MFILNPDVSCRLAKANKDELVRALRRFGVFPPETTYEQFMALEVGPLRKHAFDLWEEKRRAAFLAAQRQPSSLQSSALNQGIY